MYCAVQHTQYGAVQHIQYGAVQHNHNANMVFVRCNITTMPTWSLCGATYLAGLFKQGGQYGAVQHNHNGDMVIVRCNMMPLLLVWLCGYAGARVTRFEVRDIRHTPHHCTPAYFTL
jgi:hypothetical protein